MASKRTRRPPASCQVKVHGTRSRRSGGGDLAFGVLLGAAGAYFGQKLFSAHAEPRIRMTQLVRQYRTHPGIRAFVGQLLRGTKPYSTVQRIERVFRVIADKIEYLHDPGGEYVADPAEVLRTGVGDCDCKATALATLLEAAGYLTRFVLIPGHVFVEVGIAPSDEPQLPQQALRRREGDVVWVALEATAASAPIGWADAHSWNQAIAAGQERVIDNRT